MFLRLPRHALIACPLITGVVSACAAQPLDAEPPRSSGSAEARTHPAMGPDTGAPPRTWDSRGAPSDAVSPEFGIPDPCRVVTDPKPTAIVCGERRASPIFVAPRDVYNRAALASSGQTFYAVWCRASLTGGEAAAYDSHTGELRWKQPLEACGPVDHSEYHNAVKVRVEGAGLVIVGDESACRYVETLDLASGARSKHERLPPRT